MFSHLSLLHLLHIHLQRSRTFQWRTHMHRPPSFVVFFLIFSKWRERERNKKSVQNVLKQRLKQHHIVRMVCSFSFGWYVIFIECMFFPSFKIAYSFMKTLRKIHIKWAIPKNGSEREKWLNDDGCGAQMYVCLSVIIIFHLIQLKHIDNIISQ